MTETWKAVRRAATLAIVVAAVGCAQRSSTQTQTIDRPNAVLDEAARLDKAVDAL